MPSLDDDELPYLTQKLRGSTLLPSSSYVRRESFEIPVRTDPVVARVRG